MDSEGTRSRKEVSVARHVQRSQRFVIGISVSVDVHAERCSHRCHEAILALESIGESGAVVGGTPASASAVKSFVCIVIPQSDKRERWFVLQSRKATKNGAANCKRPEVQGSKTRSKKSQHSVHMNIEIYNHQKRRPKRRRMCLGAGARLSPSVVDEASSRPPVRMAYH